MIKNISLYWHNYDTKAKQNNHASDKSSIAQIIRS